jgi:hypothetical protein
MIVSMIYKKPLFLEVVFKKPYLFSDYFFFVVLQEPFFSSNLNICIRQPDGSYSGDSLESPKGYLDEKPENI